MRFWAGKKPGGEVEFRFQRLDLVGFARIRLEFPHPPRRVGGPGLQLNGFRAAGPVPLPGVASAPVRADPASPRQVLALIRFDHC
jgi:hypothetical protein